MIIQSNVRSSRLTDKAGGTGRKGSQGPGLDLPTAPVPGCSQLDSEATLLERLQYRCPEDPDPVPQPLLRTYIAYARQHVHPTLSEPARQVGSLCC